MIDTYTNTGKLEEELELPTEEEIIKEREDFKQVSFIELLRTSSEFQPFTLTPKLGLAYHHYLQTLASQVYEPLSRRTIATNYDELLKSILNIFQPEIWQETLSSYPTLELQALERLYILRRRSEVTKFLVDNPFLLPLLQEAYQQIRNYFGKSAKVVLEVVTDPEIEGGQELVIFIGTTLSPDEAFERLERLDEEWWLDAPANARKKLCIDVEFD